MQTRQATVLGAGLADDFFSDERVGEAWYLEGSDRSDLNVGVASVWEDYTGTGVTVGVIDSQIDYTHEDLGAYDTSLDYNFALETGALSLRSRDISDRHGTTVAGVIAAEGGNGTGSVGIAPGVTLVGFGVDYSSSEVVDDVLQALRASAALDVVNNSWSFASNFSDRFWLGEAGAEMEAALRHVVETGRDGLGTNIVFSAGNGGTYGASNYHNFQNAPYTIAVGGVTAEGDAWDQTSLGANVLISGPAEKVLTTAPNGYSYVSGTSFAAPAVSAAIALMLEANPDLGYRDVQKILSLSARRDGLTDDLAVGNGWITNGADDFNGGGQHFSDAAGFGYLNVHDAVRLAETWTTQKTLAGLDTVEVTGTSDAVLTAGSADHISYEIEVTDAIEVEHVELALDLKWRFTGDLDVYLTSPEGTTVQLVYSVEDRDFIGTLRNFAFSSVASMGEMGKGTWTVDIHNRDPGTLDTDGSPMTGSLRDVTLTLHGETEGLANDVYVYNDAFGVLYDGADLSGRQVLRDRDGGIDAVNAAAVTSDSLIDLSGARTSEIAGVALSIDAPGSIENAYGGDGDDTLVGTGGDNLLSGGRGDDTLHHSSSNDTIDGGAGTDTLHVAALSTEIEGAFVDPYTFLMRQGDETGLSHVENVEFFAFEDVTYSVSQLIVLYGEAEAPVPEAPGDDVAETPAEPEPAPEPEVPIEDTPDPGTDYAHSHTGTAGNDTMRGYSVADDMAGLAGADTIFGRGGDDRIDGGGGDDKLVAGGGDDLVFGGGGVDVVNGGYGNDRAFGGADDDRLIGSVGDDSLYGEAGNDVLRGDDGNDVLVGGAGRDVMLGGGGADIFVFDLADASAMDVIRDFNAEEGDRIVVEGVQGAGSVALSVIEKNGTVFLQAGTGDEVYRIAKILGDDVAGLTIEEQDFGSGSGFLLS
ncbi:S8 family serine peptidase [Salipiger sp.]|uniref:S8 family serine peptidase n=1 Tax=Salipiger sp. TaxID=2078585 RepID=UPI003A96EE79